MILSSLGVLGSSKNYSDENGSGGLKASSDRISLQQIQSYNEIQMSPLDLTANGLLPGDDIIVFAHDGLYITKTREQESDFNITNDKINYMKPLFVGKAWPSSVLLVNSNEKTIKKGKSNNTIYIKEKTSTCRVPLVSEVVEALLKSTSNNGSYFAIVQTYKKQQTGGIIVDLSTTLSQTSSSLSSLSSSLPLPSYLIRTAKSVHILKRRSFEIVKLPTTLSPSSPSLSVSPSVKSIQIQKEIKEIPIQMSEHCYWSQRKLAELMQNTVLPLNSSTFIQLEGGTISLELFPVVDETVLESSQYNHLYSNYVLITSDTRFIEGPIKNQVTRNNAIVQDRLFTSPSLVGGLEKILIELEELAASALLYPERLTSKGLKPPRGALLEGPPGTGKTLLAKALSLRMNIPLININGGEAFSGIVGETERRLRQTFIEAANKSPVILFIDELDGLCPKREWAGEVEARIVATMLALLDGIGVEDKILSTNGSNTDTNTTLSISTCQHTLDQTNTNVKMRAELVSLDSVLSATNQLNLKSESVNKKTSITTCTLDENKSNKQLNSPNRRIFILGATNRASAIDNALRRPGRFDRELHIGVPNQVQRNEILKVCLSRFPHRVSSIEIEQVASKLHGYVGADLAGLCREAAMCAWRRQTLLEIQTTSPSISKKNTINDKENIDEINTTLVGPLSNLSLLKGEEESNMTRSIQSVDREDKQDGKDHKEDHSNKTLIQREEILQEFLQSQEVLISQPNIVSHLVLTLTDLYQASRSIQPSALREVHVEVPKVSWSDIGGQVEVKNRLREAVEWPLTHPEAFIRMGIQPPKGVLLYGPPGCSKTMMARAMATEGGMNFIAVKGPELFSKYVGDSEKAVANIFAKARAASPCIIFFDEFDALARQRGSDGEGEEGSGGSSVGTRVVSQLLQELDGVTQLKQVVVVAATNRPDLIDKALLRPGRIDRSLLVGLPDKDAILRITEIQLDKIPCDSSFIPTRLVDSLIGYSGAEIVGLFREAAIQRIKKGGKELQFEDLVDAIKQGTIVKGITEEMMQIYKEWRV